MPVRTANVQKRLSVVPEELTPPGNTEFIIVAFPITFDFIRNNTHLNTNSNADLTANTHPHHSSKPKLSTFRVLQFSVTALTVVTGVPFGIVASTNSLISTFAPSTCIR